MIDVKKGKELLDAQVGKPYVFGYEVALPDKDPSSFDCSELVEWFFYQFGISVPDGSYNQFKVAVPLDKLPTNYPQPFDLGFLRHANGQIHHVVLYYGNGCIVHAKGTGHGVIKESAQLYVDRNRAEWAGWRRIVV